MKKKARPVAKRRRLTKTAKKSARPRGVIAVDLYKPVLEAIVVLRNLGGKSSCGFGLPKKLRMRLEWKSGDRLVIGVTPTGKLVVSKVNQLPLFGDDK